MKKPFSGFRGVDISVNMTPDERHKLREFMAVKGQATPQAQAALPESERFEPYSISAKLLGSSWSKHEDKACKDRKKDRI